MNVRVVFETECQDGVACGVVVTDTDAARSIHEAGYYLGELADRDRAAEEALLKAVTAAGEEEPETLEVGCTDAGLVERVTTGAVEGASEALQKALWALLGFENWRIRVVEQGEVQRAAELASEAMGRAGPVDVLNASTAAKQQKQAFTGVPQWTVTLLEDPGRDCPAGCGPDRTYPFGPDTPAGFCVYAARAVLQEGPLGWEAGSGQQRLTMLCPVCDAPMRIDRIGGA